ncbi:DUF2255 family protein [Promicromonospora sp. NFX87]|uniref:DUF2255 family protein n=1 Tax=Promicromonospora sp. NFX87 TaxID=3402691 RepID=UPI003AFA2AD2
MPGWTPAQLARVAATDDFHIAPYREDGITPGTAIWVWSVPVGDAVYVRSNNPASRWFAAAVRQKAGMASGGGYAGPVTYEHVTDDAVKDAVDIAFATKYGDDPHFSEDLLSRSRDQIAKLVPDATPS